jgi:hypothetical protein
MAVTVKPITLWRKEINNKPGALAETLEPLATQGADLQVVMGYRYPGHKEKAAIELYPVAGRKLSAAAQAAGLHEGSISALLVEGDNQVGLGHAIAQAIAGAGINLDFLVAQVVGRKYSAVLGFESDADMKKAVPLIRKATLSKQMGPRKVAKKGTPDASRKLR